MIKNYFVLTFLISFLIGCNKETNEFIFISNDNSLQATNNFVFYTNHNQEVYLYLTNKNERNSISKKSILSVKYKLNNEFIEAKIIDIVFSRELNLSPFIIEVDSKTKTIAKIKKDNKYMFYIGKKSDLSSNILKAVDNCTKGFVE
jgi:hypothetical protein